MLRSVRLALAAFAGLTAFAAQGATFQLDPDHSMAEFRIGHMGISRIWGRFNEVAGTFTLDANSKLSAANIVIQTTSVDTKVGRRDDHLRSADFLNANQFPTLTFVGSDVSVLDTGKYTLNGTLTLHGVSKPVSLTVQQVGTGTDSSGAARVGAEAELTIKRSAFGMTNMLDVASDDVQIFLNFEGAKQ